IWNNSTYITNTENNVVSLTVSDEHILSLENGGGIIGVYDLTGMNLKRSENIGGHAKIAYDPTTQEIFAAASGGGTTSISYFNADLEYIDSIVLETDIHDFKIANGNRY